MASKGSTSLDWVATVEILEVNLASAYTRAGVNPRLTLSWSEQIRGAGASTREEYTRDFGGSIKGVIKKPWRIEYSCPTTGDGRSPLDRDTALAVFLDVDSTDGARGSRQRKTVAMGEVFIRDFLIPVPEAGGTEAGASRGTPEADFEAVLTGTAPTPGAPRAGEPQDGGIEAALQASARAHMAPPRGIAGVTRGPEYTTTLAHGGARGNEGCIIILTNPRDSEGDTETMRVRLSIRSIRLNWSRPRQAGKFRTLGSTFFGLGSGADSATNVDTWVPTMRGDRRIQEDSHPGPWYIPRLGNRKQFDLAIRNFVYEDVFAPYFATDGSALTPTVPGIENKHLPWHWSHLGRLPYDLYINMYPTRFGAGESGAVEMDLYLAAVAIEGFTVDQVWAATVRVLVEARKGKTAVVYTGIEVDIAVVTRVLVRYANIHATAWPYVADETRNPEDRRGAATPAELLDNPRITRGDDCESLSHEVYISWMMLRGQGGAHATAWNEIGKRTEIHAKGVFALHQFAGYYIPGLTTDAVKSAAQSEAGVGGAGTADPDALVRGPFVCHVKPVLEPRFGFRAKTLAVVEATGIHERWRKAASSVIDWDRFAKLENRPWAPGVEGLLPYLLGEPTSAVGLDAWPVGPGAYGGWPSEVRGAWVERFRLERLAVIALWQSVPEGKTRKEASFPMIMRPDRAGGPARIPTDPFYKYTIHLRTAVFWEVLGVAAFDYPLVRISRETGVVTYGVTHQEISGFPEPGKTGNYRSVTVGTFAATVMSTSLMLGMQAALRRSRQLPPLALTDQRKVEAILSLNNTRFRLDHLAKTYPAPTGEDAMTGYCQIIYCGRPPSKADLVALEAAFNRRDSQVGGLAWYVLPLVENFVLVEIRVWPSHETSSSSSSSSSDDEWFSNNLW